MRLLNLTVALFFGIAAADLILGCRFHLGDALKEGLGVITELLLLMTGFMALSPWIAGHIAPAISPFLIRIGCDPSLFAGILFSCDAGGAYLAQEIGIDSEAMIYNGLIVASFFGTSLTGAVPLALTNTKGDKRKAAVKGLTAAFIFLPFACILTGLFCGMSLLMMVRNTWPIALLSIVLLFGLLFFQNLMVRFFSILALLIKLAAYAGFSIAVWQDAGGFILLEGLTPLDEIYPVIVRIGVFLGGILPIFSLLLRALRRPLILLSKRLKLTTESISYLFLSTSNDIPTLMNLSRLDSTGITVNVAYLMMTAYTVGDFLAFTMQFRPALAFPMMFGRLASGILLIMICISKSIRKTDA